MPNLVICLTVLRFAFFRPRDPPTNTCMLCVIPHRTKSDTICPIPIKSRTRTQELKNHRHINVHLFCKFGHF